jgi:1,4-alpha-glucan branching enzyme
VDSEVVELLGGPLTHPFQPLLDGRIRAFALRSGLDDTALRIGHRPAGIWAPECGYAPGMEDAYAAAGVERFLVDGPSLRGDTAAARTVGSSDVVCFGRDLAVTYRVWSPKAGYPGHANYRDFHTWAHEVGMKPSRVTGQQVAPQDKAPYDPTLAADTLRVHIKDFVDTVVTRLRRLRQWNGREALVVAAYDTELFGHWWHEGPAWLEGVLRALPEAGVRVTTLRGALGAGHLGPPVDLPASSWGSGKDWRVWDGEQVADMVEDNAALQRRLVAIEPGAFRDPALDLAVNEAMLALSSDWAFMVTKDSAADYARRRARVHTERFAALVRGERPVPLEDRVFGHLDARLL